MGNFTWFDVVLVLIILWSVLSGMRAGFARVVVGFAAAVAGLLVGFWCYRIMAAKLLPWLKTPALADTLGFLILFVGVLIVGALIGALLSRLLRWMGLSWFNRFLGGVAGFFRGVLVIAALAGILVAFSPSPTPDFLARSRVLPYVGEVAWWLVDLAPRELKDAYDQQMQNLRRMWRQQPANPPGQVV
jgi:membrane protein required for colicin V production